MLSASVMIALLLLLSVPIIMWLMQTALLRLYGLPVRWAIDMDGVPKPARTTSRAVTQLCLAAAIVLYPLLRGESIVGYYAGLLPIRSAGLFLQGAAVSVLFLCLLFGAWLAADQLEIDIHQSRKRWMRRLILLLPTTLLGAFVEEFLFRGVLLADLLRSFPQSTAFAVAIGVVIFAVAHYVRRVKRRWTFPGHLMLGLLLCVAFVRTQTLWLPAGLHAGGILIIMGMRPFLRYRGPGWLIGASTFPFAGIVGLAGLAMLTAFVVRHYGV
ncbi:MAG TPA: CPBP family intramembrane glutamic endopeptidase [Phycisphaerae bacterium]|nr:CPBP family intramembrane glutamic endopeptidase [Phycisphaerae bacterium]